MTDATCSISGCTNPARKRGWCNKHYKRWQIHGDPEATVLLMRPFPESLLRRLRFCPPAGMSTGCVEFTGYLDPCGYGKVKYDNGTMAHRASYELLVGPIPEGLVLDHLCRNRSCVNPAHLEPVTHAENVRRGVSYWASLTHCKNGHEFTPDNTRTRPDSGHRACRACGRERWRKKAKLRKGGSA